MADPGGEWERSPFSLDDKTPYVFSIDVWENVNLPQTSRREAFCDAWKALKIRFRPALRPELTGRAYDAPPNTLVGSGGEIPSNFPPLW